MAFFLGSTFIALRWSGKDRIQPWMRLGSVGRVSPSRRKSAPSGPCWQTPECATPPATRRAWASVGPRSIARRGCPSRCRLGFRAVAVGSGAPLAKRGRSPRHPRTRDTWDLGGRRASQSGIWEGWRKGDAPFSLP
ncbi:hypothetical protein [Deinococcus hopiensis]|uniref:hypothetical protein n=1 Tax=Deinococcus hopiensis TaxID=309885 RepID=UPI003CCBC7C4